MADLSSLRGSGSGLKSAFKGALYVILALWVFGMLWEAVISPQIIHKGEKYQCVEWLFSSSGAKVRCIKSEWVKEGTDAN